jgi:hypothetical protein
MTKSKGILKRVPHAFKDKRQAAFLKAYSKLGTIRAACEAAGISRSTHKKWLERDENYPARYAQAREEFADAIEAAVVQRVKEGELEFIPNPRTGIAYDKNGEPIMQRRSNAQRDLAVLRRFKPEYREESKLQLSGGIGMEFSKPDITPALVKEVMKELAPILASVPFPSAVIEGEARELPKLSSAADHAPTLSVVDSETEEG